MADIKLYGTLIRDDDTNTQKIVNASQVAGGYFVCPSKPTSGVWANGQLCYCTEDKKFYQYNGTDWEEKKYVEEHQSLEGYATEEYVDKAIETIPEVDLTDYVLKDDLRYAEEGLTTSIDTHTKNKNNPHEITAEQIGLGNVLNVASYSKTENDELLKNYALKEDLFSKSYNDLTDKPEIPDLTGYATEGYVDAEIKTELEKLSIPSIDGLATEEFVTNKIDAIVFPETDLSNYYVKSEVDALIPDEVQLLDTNVTLSTELKTYYNVGKITNASGTNPVPIGKAGDTLRDVLNNLFSMDEIQPTITQNPSVSCSLSSTESDERGTDISQVSYSITFNDGAYTNSSNTGVKMTGYSFAEGNSSSTTNTSGTLTFSETYTVGTSSKFSTTVTADYSHGNIAKTNLGNDSNPIVRIESGDIECTTTFSKTAVDYPYYVSSNVSSILGLSSVTKVKKSTSLITSSGQSCNYSANAYIWIFIRKGTNTSQPTKTIQAYSDIAKEWGTFLGGTEKMGEITFNKENGKSDTFYAYRTTNVAQAADSATFRLQ